MNKTTAGTATLTAANSYTGDTNVNAGKLLVNNITGSGTGSGNVIVYNTGILGGSGSMSGAVTVNSGGHIATGTGGVGSGLSLTAPSVDLKDGSASRLYPRRGEHAFRYQRYSQCDRRESA